jgi:hypothetical protein
MMGDVENTIDIRQNMHKARARQAVCSDGDTPAPSTSFEFIIYSCNTRWRGISQREGTWLCNPQEQEKPVTASI